MSLLPAPSSSLGAVQQGSRLLFQSALCLQCQFGVQTNSLKAGFTLPYSTSSRLPIRLYRNGSDRSRWYSSGRQPPFPGSSAGSRDDELRQRLQSELKTNPDLADRLSALGLQKEKPACERADSTPSPTSESPDGERVRGASEPPPERPSSERPLAEQQLSSSTGNAKLGGHRSSGDGSSASSPLKSAINFRSLQSALSSHQLPSEIEKMRWTLSKRFSRFMDTLQVKLAIWSQQVNKYTGTDYSAISALREEIKEAEQLVKRKIGVVQSCKAALDEAHSRQASSQKEVVGLLERKQSWSATDLERYMALIRSEHINEQAIQNAKDKVIQAEQSLEETRIRLEKKERLQYHEEQVWSDTIRRNSTWVTIGLMGLNILLLLSNVLLIEPWRRRRLVREIQGSLDNNLALTLEATKESGAGGTPTSAPMPAAELVERALYGQVDEVVPKAEEVYEKPARTEGSNEFLKPDLLDAAALSEAEMDLPVSSIPAELIVESSEGVSAREEGTVGTGSLAPELLTAPPAPTSEQGNLTPSSSAAKSTEGASEEGRETVPELLGNIPTVPMWLQQNLNSRVLALLDQCIFRAYWLADYFFARDRMVHMRVVDRSVLALEWAVSGVLVGALGTLLMGRAWR